MGRSFLEKMFWYPNYFTIAIRKKDHILDSLTVTKRFQPTIEMKGNPSYWVADPMLAEDAGRVYLFYEACYKGKGRIEVRELLSPSALSEPIVVLEDDYHMSYPFVFRHAGSWYMIPESCADNCVRLYKAVHFPYKWEEVCILLEGRYVDTSVFPLRDRLFMQTYLANSENEAVKPYAFWLQINNDSARVKPLKWESFNPYRVRGAGPTIIDGDRMLRPSQISTEHSYGQCLQFKEIQILDESVAEKDLFEIMPEHIVFHRYPYDGLHTYTSTENYEAIDVRCAFRDLAKPIKKIIRMIRNQHE